MSTETFDFKKDVRRYLAVFIALAALTAVTVAASYWDVGETGGIILALIIATVKAALVACYFMHLISEKKFIYVILILTAVFFVGLMLLPLGEYKGAQVGVEFLP